MHIQDACEQAYKNGFAAGKLSEQESKNTQGKNSMDSLGNRMKGYEDISRIYLTKRSPVIIRIDGRAFHTFTRGFKKPFDAILMNAMKKTAQSLCEKIAGCKLAYTQSDEISLLLIDYDTNETQPWFENNLQKLVSVAASMATLAFNKAFDEYFGLYDQCFQECWQDCEQENMYRKKLFEAREKGATFDARAFILPKEEVCNYFIWRQQDATRNSILSVAQAHFSHKELQGKKCDILQDMLFKEHGINWNNYPIDEKRGSCVVKTKIPLNGVMRSKWVIDEQIPIFTAQRTYIDRHVFGEELQ